MKFRPGQLIQLKADGHATGYDHGAWGKYIENFKLRGLNSSVMAGYWHDIERLHPALVLGEAIQLPADPLGPLIRKQHRFKWIEVLYNEERIVVNEEDFEAL